MHVPWGTIVNTVSVIIGSTIGLIFQKRLQKADKRFERIIFQAVGLFTIMMGILMVAKVKEPLVIVISLILGGVTGELLRIEQRLESLGEWIKERTKMGESRFTEGMVSAFLIFCVGSMTVVGCIDEGLRGNYSLLFIKSLLDGIISITLAATLGAGVLFSAFPLLLFQLSLTLIAFLFRGVFSETVIAELTTVGGILIMGVGLMLLDVKKIRVGNLLPAIVYVVLLTLARMKWFVAA